jgi:TRAP-type C4-dicarboxylate transport system substrate-binding protein
MTNHVWNNEILTMSKKTWEAFTPEQRKIVQDTSNEVGVFRMDLQKQMETSRVEDLKKLGMQIVVPKSLDPYRKLSAEIKAKYAAKYAKYEWAKWHDRVLSIGK